ncbi:CJH_07325 family protein [Helicobacter sp. MIT 11-5569]|uniref:CJH_07325 family protein n=1 Tax=Helicobacter sp. MIT 11-5569 TaxID=1548151 RepID=UPI00051FC45F|nr:CJH_07325 family protein [Helicobacter sp. MIT 11-5569]TLD84452.1 CJH_07325 family protein [Helicobacter sp. MIT 11-5569]
MNNQKSAQRDSYGKVNYVDSYHDYTGNVGQLTYGKDNKKLNESLKKTSDLLDKIYQEYRIEERIAKRQF